MTEHRDYRPLLVLVSGAPGSGKTTLARRLAGEDALWLPLLSVDAFKRGLAETQGVSLAVDSAARPTITGSAVGAFFATIEYFLRSGMSMIAEFSFCENGRVRETAPAAGGLHPVANTVVSATRPGRRWAVGKRPEHRRTGLYLAPRVGPYPGAADLPRLTGRGGMQTNAHDRYHARLRAMRAPPLPHLLPLVSRTLRLLPIPLW